VALPREKDHVPRPGHFQGVCDGLPPIRDPLKGGAPHPGLDLVDDRVGILGPRIVRGHDDHVGAADGRTPHGGALPPIPIAAGTEDEDEAARIEGTERLQDPLERVRGVCVVEHDRHRITNGELEPAGRLGSVGEAERGLLQAHPHQDADPNCGKGVLHVEATQEGKGHRYVVTAPPHPKAAPFP
jgi:hypothetical protein